MKIPAILRKRSTAVVSLAIAGASLTRVVHIDPSMMMQVYLLMLPFQLAALAGVALYYHHGKPKSANRSAR